jgi:hypothetical protein
MVHNDEATLITLAASGSTVNRIETPVFCGKKSVGYREFYAAIEVGMNPTYVFEMDVDEYEQACSVENEVRRIPTELIYGGAKYNIIRTYEKPDGTIEVTVSL